MHMYTGPLHSTEQAQSLILQNGNFSHEFHINECQLGNGIALYKMHSITLIHLTTQIISFVPYFFDNDYFPLPP